jgi:sialate O-acetylesterase
MKHPRLRFALIVGLLCAAGLRADVTLAPLFTDHGVLQRDRPVPVWGRAGAGETVTVAFQGQQVATKAGSDGRWTAWLQPLAANAAGGDLVVTGKNTITLHDVLVGEVWLCSGQSNMEFLVHGANLRLLNADQEVAAAHYPLIRHIKIKRAESDTPIGTASGSWEVCSPATVGQFTAVGYFFGRDIFKALGVPVGLVNSSYGGTRVEAWMPAEAFLTDPSFASVAVRWRQTLAEAPGKQAAYDAVFPAWSKADAAAIAAGPAKLAAFLKGNPKPYPPDNHGSPATPSGLFNAMINPLLPYGLRGVIWYQGESNAARASEYHRLFAAMITSWRAAFGQGDLPFYWVQLANYARNDDPTHQTWAFLREAQTQTLSLPATGQAVAIDIGNPDDIHPANKQEVGRRLALIAKNRTYGIPGDFSGPVFARAVREGSSLRVTFTYAETGLTAAGKPLQSFEVAGADRQFHPAAASIEGDSLLVRSPNVPSPEAVRYAWRNAPEANLYNGAGLPAAPFRSDGW